MWEQIQANRRRSVGLVLAMAAVMAGMGFFGGEALAPRGVGLIGLAAVAVILSTTRINPALTILAGGVAGFFLLG